MKKVIFSAIAMIAFVGSSMANDNNPPTIVLRDCQAEGFNARDSAAQFVDYSLAEEIGEVAQDNCEKQTKTGKYAPKPIGIQK